MSGIPTQEGGITQSGNPTRDGGSQVTPRRKGGLLLMRRVISNHDVTHLPCAEAVCLNSKTEAWQAQNSIHPQLPSAVRHVCPERKLHGADELREKVAKLEAELEAARKEREEWCAITVSFVLLATHATPGLRRLPSPRLLQKPLYLSRRV